jgi:arylformamidase
MHPVCFFDRVLRKIGTLLAAMLCLFLSPARLPAAEPSVPDAAALAPPFEVQVFRDLVYRDLWAGEDAGKGKNKLDLYCPKGRKEFPVIFFVHGGAWRHGDKQYLGVYSSLAMCLARLGFGMVVTNYRLSPTVQHPEHIKDVARAFAWTCQHIAQYGGCPDQIFVCGHSAGGHLVALLATDERYVKAEGLSLGAIRGAIPISGVYDVSLPGPGLFQTVFGKDSESRRAASPVNHVCGREPPFLIVYADRDFATCDQMSERLCKVLQDCEREAQTLAVKDRNHITVLLSAIRAEDPLVRAIVQFVAAHTPKPATAGS